MNTFLQNLGFELPKLIWQIVNFAILFGILGLILLIPRWIVRKINSIEKNIKEINEKINKDRQG